MSDQSNTSAPAPPRVEARLSADKVQLLVLVDDPHGNIHMAASRLKMELPPFELADEPDHETLVELLSKACQPGESLEDYALLEGRKPFPRANGSVMWARDFFASGFSIESDTDSVDYWDRAEQRALTADEPIAIVTMPREGIPGLDLQGNEISVDKPKAAKLRAGKGVRAEESVGRITYYADVAGRLSNKDGCISVENVYAINGDVNINVGNIQHTGTVTISGDVLEGATIEVDGDMFVKGLIEPCSIRCGGDLVVSGGIVGDGEHTVEVGGSVQARYLNEVDLTCGGNVTVTGQIDHCHIRSAGALDCARGRIAGGRIKLYRGGRVGQAGAPGATGTEIVVGVNWKTEREHAQWQERLNQLNDARGKLAAAIEQAAAQGAMEDSRRDAVLKLKDKLAQLDQAIESESDAHKAKVEECIAGSVREFGVLTETYSGVTFRVGSSVVVSDRKYDLPRLIALRRDKARILPMGELNEPD